MIEGALWRKWVFYNIPLILFVFVLLFPFYWMIITTFRPDGELYKPWNAVGHDVLQYLCFAGAGPQLLAGQAEPEGHAQAVYVSRGSKRFAPQVFGRQVRQLTDEVALVGGIAAQITAGDAEIEQPGHAVAPNQNVLQRDVAVEHVEQLALSVARVVHCFQARERIQRHA